MGQDKDTFIHLNGLTIIHQKIRGNEVSDHEHDEHEFFFPLQGEIQINVNGELLKAGAGKLIYMPPGLSHSFKADSASQGERAILIFEKKAWDKYDGGSFEAACISASQLCKEIIFQLLIYPKTKAAVALVQTLVQTLSEMLEAGKENYSGELSHLMGRTEDERMKKSLQFIADEFSSNLSAELIAKKSGLSVRNLNRLFLKEFGLSPKQVVTFYRIDQAKKLLSTGKKTVTDTAFDVGYSSVSQFIATFRKHTGQLPSSFLPTI
ncbi:MAG: helix-turn-helix domain-containing protein [Bdellovibrio sp.]|jgi:AraC-like DNA-binding protein